MITTIVIGLAVWVAFDLVILAAILVWHCAETLLGHDPGQHLFSDEKATVVQLYPSSRRVMAAPLEAPGSSYQAPGARPTGGMDSNGRH